VSGDWCSSCLGLQEHAGAYMYYKQAVCSLLSGLEKASGKRCREAALDRKKTKQPQGLELHLLCIYLFFHKLWPTYNLFYLSSFAPTHPRNPTPTPKPTKSLTPNLFHQISHIKTPCRPTARPSTSLLQDPNQAYPHKPRRKAKV